MNQCKGYLRFLDPYRLRKNQQDRCKNIKFDGLQIDLSKSYSKLTDLNGLCGERVRIKFSKPTSYPRVLTERIGIGNNRKT